MTSASFEVSLLSCSSKACLRACLTSHRISSVFIAICVRNERKNSVYKLSIHQRNWTSSKKNHHLHYSGPDSIESVSVSTVGIDSRITLASFFHHWSIHYHVTGSGNNLEAPSHRYSRYLSAKGMWNNLLFLCRGSKWGSLSRLLSWNVLNNHNPG